MEPQDWIERWAEGRIGFHLPRVHPRLSRQAHRLPEGARVLVPLSGKSLDVAWLAGRGHEVTAVELAEQAVVDFHREHRLEPRVESQPPFTLYRAPGITTWQGDLFALGPDRLGRFDAIYDRGAWVALEAPDRDRYVDLLLDLLRPGGRWLLIALDYDAGEMSGPPFALSAAEIRSRLEPHGTLERLEKAEILDKEPHFREKGLTSLRESAWLFERGPS